MPISLKAQVERTAKTPLPRRCARVGGLCGFHDTAERVPAESHKTGRYANVREHCGHGKRRKRTAAGEFWQREKPQAAKQEKDLTLFCASPSTSARSAGSFGGMKMALFCGCQKWNDAVISQKPRSTSKIKDNFDAITISGGFEHENRRTKPPHSLDGRYGLAAGAGAV